MPGMAAMDEAAAVLPVRPEVDGASAAATALLLLAAAGEEVDASAPGQLEGCGMLAAISAMRFISACAPTQQTWPTWQACRARATPKYCWHGMHGACLTASLLGKAGVPPALRTPQTHATLHARSARKLSNNDVQPPQNRVVRVPERPAGTRQAAASLTLRRHAAHRGRHHPGHLGRHLHAGRQPRVARELLKLRVAQALQLHRTAQAGCARCVCVSVGGGGNQPASVKPLSARA